MGRPPLRGMRGGFLQELVNEGLVRLALFGRHLPQRGQQGRREANGNELFRHAASRPSDATRSLQFRGGGLGDIRKINLRVGHIFAALSGSPALLQ